MTPADKTPDPVALDEKGLLPCPFCACEATAYVRLGEIYRDVIVTCSGCEAEIGSTDAWTERASDEQGLAKTVAAWNRRAPANPAQVTDADLDYGLKLIAEAIEAHFGERDDAYEYEMDDTTIHDVWEAYDALTAAIGAGGQAVAWIRKWAFDGIDVMAMPKKDRPAGWMLHEVTRHQCLPDDVPLYTHPATSGQAVAVKSLEWFGTGTLWGHSPFGSYSIDKLVSKDGYVWSAPTGDWINADALGEAKAAAQADYERRIKSAIVGGGWSDIAAPLTKGGEDAE